MVHDAVMHLDVWQWCINWLVAWCCVNALSQISLVTLWRARLVLGWVSVQVYRLSSKPAS